MKQLLFIASLCVAHVSFGQTASTFAGQENGDPVNTYESRTSSVDLDDTYFSYPNGICITPSGLIYVAERNKIRLITSKVYIRAGNPGGPTLSEGYKNATGTQATFRNPSGMVADSDNNLYVCDAENHCIRRIAKFTNVSNGQIVSTFVGANPTSGLPGYGTTGSTDATGTSARFNQPQGICSDTNGNFYVTDYLNFTIRKVTPSGVVTTIAGKAGVEGTADNTTGSNARFGGPWGIAMLDDNHLVVTDPWNTNIRKVNISTGASTTIAGPTSGSDAQFKNGTLTASRFRAPKGVVVVNGIIYVNDQNVIRAIDIANNSVTSFAGDSSVYDIVDGTGVDAAFTELDGMMTDGKGNLFVTENSGLVASHVIRKVSINSLVPKADFTANKTNVIVDEKVNLQDISTGATTTARTWTISPANYTIHTGDLGSQTVQISFQATGFYEVKLEITNEFGQDAKTIATYFNVSTTGSISSFNANGLVKAYPNPASDVVNVKLAPQFIVYKTQMKLYNAQGQVMYDGVVQQELNTADLPNGLYYLTVESDDLRAVKRLIISH